MTIQTVAASFTVAVLVGCLMPGAAVAQQAAVESWTPPRTGDGHPDLQGVWDFATITPFERPAEFGEKEVLTDEEAAALEQQTVASRVDAAPPSGSVGSYNQAWFDRGTRVVEDRRTSLIVAPSDGRLPALQPGVTMIMDVRPDRPATGGAVAPTGRVRLRTGGVEVPAGPEERGLAERCLLGFNTGPPMISSAYNNNIQIFQNADYVVIINEMVHDIRKVILDDRPRLPENVRQWMGDSRGRWEGDMLVVETTNFTDKTAALNPGPTTSAGSGRTLRLVERFMRLDEDSLLYEFTIDDPTTFTQPVIAASTMSRNDNPIFEYACHEGNYGLLNVLRGAREAESRAADSEQQ
jgi:hypothetical protein